MALLIPRWLDEVYDNTMLQAAQKWVTMAKAATEEWGTFNPFVYHNFALVSQKPLCSYGANKYFILT